MEDFSSKESSLEKGKPEDEDEKKGGGGYLDEVSGFYKRVGAALFYGISSLAIMIVNKQVLTVRKFPSPQVLGFGQMVATVLVIFTLKFAGLIHFPNFSRDVIRRIFPLPLFYLSNMIFGLVVTQELSLPMLTVLRRFSILFTLILQYLVLGSKPLKSVVFSVFLMIFGAVVAASNDLSFNLRGYVVITLNNLATAGNGVVTKVKLNNRELGSYGLVYYNSLVMVIPTFLFCLMSGSFQSLHDFHGWKDPIFIIEFLASCFFGFVLMYSSNLCTQMNSALDTTIIGCLKNIIITYIGMIFGGDYIFSWINFIGLNISIFGSLVYTRISFSQKKSPPPQKESEPLVSVK